MEEKDTEFLRSVFGEENYNEIMDYFLDYHRESGEQGDVGKRIESDLIELVSSLDNEVKYFNAESRSEFLKKIKQKEIGFVYSFHVGNDVIKTYIIGGEGVEDDDEYGSHEKSGDNNRDDGDDGDGGERFLVPLNTLN